MPPTIKVLGVVIDPCHAVVPTEIENLAMSHGQVAEAAVIAIPNPRWGERPLLVVVPRDEPGQGGGYYHEKLREELYK